MNISYEEIGDDEKLPLIVWAHGWGCSKENMRELAGAFGESARHILLDLPGFGQSDIPSEIWGTCEYADEIAKLLQNKAPFIWAGHSFGGKVGIALAARHPDPITHLILIGASGLLGKRRTWVKIKILTFKLAKIFCPWAAARFFGSSDYKTAGEMRRIFVKVVNEEMNNEASKISCPTLLLYGEDDDQTPVEIGKRLSNLIPNSHLKVLPKVDHYSILNKAKHIVAARIKEFIS